MSERAERAQRVRVFPVALFWIAATVLVATLLSLAATSPRARMNILQAASVLFFIAVFSRTESSSVPLAEDAAGLPALKLALGMALASLIYGSAFDRYYLGDDFGHVLDSAGAFLDGARAWFFEGHFGTFYRPIGFLSLYLDYRAFGPDLFGWHAVNLAIHLVSVAGVYALSRSLGLGGGIASTAGLLFAVMPIHPETVAWVSARFDQLSGAFTLWSVAAYLRYRVRGGSVLYAAAMSLGALAMLSKENAFVIPFVLVLIELTGILGDRRFAPPAGFTAMALGIFSLRWLVLGGIGGYVAAGGEPAALAIGPKTAIGVLIRSPAQMLLGLNWTQPHAVFGIAIGSALAAYLATLAMFTRTNAHCRLTAFLGGWIVLWILPGHFLSGIGAGLTNSRILYLSSAGAAVLLALLLAEIRPDRTRHSVSIGLAVLLALGLVFNLEAWRSASELSARFVSEVRSLAPTPERRARFDFRNIPDTVDGVFVIHPDLAEAIRLAYGRDDLIVTSCVAAQPCTDAGTTGSGPRYVFEWTGPDGPLLARIGG